MQGKTAKTVIIQLKSIFDEQGIPEELFSDNMPFNSHEFKTFAKEYGFRSTTSSPRFARSNGLVKRTIGTVKQLSRKADDPYIALLEFRNTPITGLKLILTYTNTSKPVIAIKVTCDSKNVTVMCREQCETYASRSTGNSKVLLRSISKTTA